MKIAIRIRIKKVVYKNHTEHWVQKSIRLFGVHLFWSNTTISYYTDYKNAELAMEDLLFGHDIEILKDRAIIEFK